MSTVTNPAKTIAVWYESRKGDVQKSNLDLHFNLWKLPNGGSFQRFLDIGLKLHEPAGVGQLCLYFPFNVTEDCFEDIVGKFITDPNLVSAIFNENYTVSAEAGSKSHLIDGVGGQFDIYETSKQNVKRENKFGGTVFRLDFEPHNRPLYLRFRVSGAYPASLSITQKATNAIVQSAFSQTEMIDFRVNEARDLDKDLLVEMRRQSNFHLAKVHFFFVCSYGEDIVGAHEQYAKCRNLENYRWASYVDNKDLKNQIYLAYHWKKENRDDFGVLIRTKFERNDIWVLIKYLLVLLAITLLFNIISSYAFRYLTTSSEVPSQSCAFYSPSNLNLPPRFLMAPRNLNLDVQFLKIPILQV